MLKKLIGHAEGWIKDLQYTSDSIPSLEGRSGRPIFVSFFACWQKDFEKGTEQVIPVVMGGVLMLIIAMLAEALRFLREGFESSAHLVISRNRIDVKTKEVWPAAVECDADDENCLRVVEEVVVPLTPTRLSWRRILNGLLYGIQCGLQLLCLIGVLSLNIPLIAAVVIGIFLGRLCFYWRPRQKPFIQTSKPSNRS